MARPLRIEFAGALYHITSRGDRREDIYINDSDRQIFLALLSDGCERFNWVCHAYCLMDNHYHLLIETPEANLSKGMRYLNGVYTQRFNRSHNKSGHVFQGRYKGILVEKESYLLELARYIVLNPVRAGMVRSAQEWPWSSYLSTAGKVAVPEFLKVNWLLSPFDISKKTAQEKYRKFIAEGKGQPSPWRFLKNQVYLGSQIFVERHISALDGDQDLSEVPSSQRRKLPKLLSCYEKNSECRDDAIVLAIKSGGYTQKEVGAYFGLHYSRVSRILTGAKDKT